MQNEDCLNKIKDTKVLQLGITFKENCPDIRNSKAIDIAEGLKEFGCIVDIFDPWADPEEILREYGCRSVSDISDLSENKYDAIVLTVAHKEFLSLDLEQFKAEHAVVYDIKGVLPREFIDGRL